MRGKAVLAVVLCLLSASLVLSYSLGPPDRRTGAPGESTCASCHQNLNIGDGTIWLDVPSSYVPAETLSLELHLSKPGQRAWGFELTLLDTLDQPAGTILRTDLSRTQLSLNSNGRTYLKHTHAGTDSGTVNTAPGWQFQWIAPSSNIGPVKLYACGNAADGSGSSLGDYCYTLVHTIYPTPQVACCSGTTGNVDASGIIDISDLSLLILYVTVPGTSIPCPEEANINATGVIDLSDISALILYLTLGTYTFPQCPGQS